MAGLFDRSRSMFGPLGNQFEALRHSRDARAKYLWEQPSNAPLAARYSWEEVTRKFYDESGFWYDVLCQTISLARRTGYPLPDLLGRLPTLWELLSISFSPSLKPWAATAKNREFVFAVEAVSSCYFHALRIGESEALLPYSFASYSNADLIHLATSHRRIFEAGGGSFYTAKVLHDAGVDVVSVDNGSFDAVYDRTRPWISELAAKGVALVGNALDHRSELGAGRSLLIAWPEPGSSWPVELLKAHAERGGTQLLLKLGLYVGQIRGDELSGYCPPANPIANVLSFFEELGRKWKRVGGPDVPQYQPDDYMDTLWVFTRR